MIYVLYPIDEKATGVIITTVLRQEAVLFSVKVAGVKQTHEIKRPIC